MNAITPVVPSRVQSNTSRAVVKRMLQVVITYLVLTVILFASSGRLNWFWAWAYLGVRGALEDRTLQDELPGYEEYAQRVRYRLMPTVMGG